MKIRKSEGFTPPASVAAAAAKGLRYRQKASPSNKGGLSVSEASKQGIGSGVQRATNLKNRDSISLQTIKRMKAFFDRHEKNKSISPENKGTPWNDKGHVAWLLWGGDAGRAWANKIIRQQEGKTKKSMALPARIRRKRIRRSRIIAKASPMDKLPSIGVRPTVHLYHALGPAGRKQVDAYLKKLAGISKSFELEKAKKGERVAGAKYIMRIPKPGGGYKYIYTRAQLARHLKEEHLKEGTVIDAHGDREHHVEIHKRDKKGKLEVTHHATGEKSDQVTAEDLHEHIKENIKEGVKEDVEKLARELEEVKQYGSEKQIQRIQEEYDSMFAMASALYSDFAITKPLNAVRRAGGGPGNLENLSREGNIENLIPGQGPGGAGGGPGNLENLSREGNIDNLIPGQGPGAPGNIWKPPTQEADTLHEDVLPKFPGNFHPRGDLLTWKDADGNVIGSAFRHQAEASARINASWKERDGFVLMDVAGLGKTVEALMAMKQRGGKRNLIVVPTSGKENLKKHWGEDAELLGIDIKTEIDGSDGYFVASYDEIYDSKVKVGPFTEDPGFTDEQLDQLAEVTDSDPKKKRSKRIDLVKGMFPDMDDEQAASIVMGLQDYPEIKPEFKDFDTIAFDEAHNMANPASMQSQAAVKLQLQEMGPEGGNAKMLYMSATPFTTLRDTHYLRGLGWFRTGEEFAKWAETGGARVNRKSDPVGDIPFAVDNPDSPVPTAIISAKMHFDGAGLKRTPKFGPDDPKINSSFKKLGITKEEHKDMFSKADQIANIAKEAGISAFQIGGMMTMWKKSAWEMVKADEAIAAAKAALSEDPPRQVAIFTQFTKHDHASLGGGKGPGNTYGNGLAGNIRKQAQDAKGAQKRKMLEAADKIDALVASMHTEDVLGRISRELGVHVGGSEDNWHDHVGQIHGQAKDASGRLIGRGRHDSTVADLKAYQGHKDENGNLVPPTKRVIVASMDKGGTGLSYHDKYGFAPRTQINLSLPWHAVGFDQVSGRSHRLGSKSDTNQVWLHGDDDSEKNVASIIASKMTSMNALVSGDPGGNLSPALLANFETGNNLSSDQQARIMHAMQTGELPADIDGSTKELINSMLAEKQATEAWFKTAVNDMRAGGNPFSEAGALLNSRNATEILAADQERRTAAGQLVAKFGMRIQQDPDSPMRFRVHTDKLPKSVVKGFTTTPGGKPRPGVNRYPDGSLQISDPSVFATLAKQINTKTGEYSPKKLKKGEAVFDKSHGKAFALSDWSDASLGSHHGKWTSNAPEGGHTVTGEKVKTLYKKDYEASKTEMKTARRTAEERQARAIEKFPEAPKESVAQRRRKTRRKARRSARKSGTSVLVPRLLAKGRALPIGSVRTHGGVKKRKTAQGWVPVGKKPWRVKRSGRSRPSRGREVTLSKKELKNLLKNGHYSIISAGRNPEHPEEMWHADDDPRFAARHEELRRELTERGFKFTEVEGHYGGREKSFVVHHTPKAKDDGQAKSFIVQHKNVSEHQIMRQLGKAMNQDSVIHSKGGVHEMHYTTGPNEGTHYKGSGHQFLPEAEDYYTSVAHGSGKGSSKFSLNFDWDSTHGYDSAVLKGRLLLPKMVTKGGRIRSLLPLSKGKPAQVGEVRTWEDGVKRRKQSDGEWVPVESGGNQKKKQPSKNLESEPPDQESQRQSADPSAEGGAGSIPENLKGRSDVSFDEIQAAGGIKKVLGHLKLSKMPATGGNNPVDTDKIKFDLSGDLDSHAVIRWKDAKNRNQSAYSEVFVQRNAAKKWEHITKIWDEASQVGPKAHAIMSDDNRDERERDSAAIVAIIAATGLRPGSMKSVRDENHYGVKTLLDEHVTVNGDVVSFQFVGKSGKDNTATIVDAELANYIGERKATASERDGFIFDNSNSITNRILKESGGETRLKDLRTVYATKKAVELLAASETPPPMPENVDEALKQIKAAVIEASKQVAEDLNNTPAMARGSYIAPPIIAAWARRSGANDELAEKLAKAGEDEDDFDESAADEIMDDAAKEKIYVSKPGEAKLDPEDEEDEPDELEQYILPAVLQDEGDEEEIEEDADDNEVEQVEKALIRYALLFKAATPEGAGWQPVPGGKHGGYRRRHGTGFEYWYPSGDHAARARDHHKKKGEKMRKKLGKVLRKRGAKQEHIEKFLDEYDHHTRQSEAAHGHHKAATEAAAKFTSKYGQKDEATGGGEQGGGEQGGAGGGQNMDQLEANLRGMGLSGRVLDAIMAQVSASVGGGGGEGGDQGSANVKNRRDTSLDAEVKAMGAEKQQQDKEKKMGYAATQHEKAVKRSIRKLLRSEKVSRIVEPDMDSIMAWVQATADKLDMANDEVQKRLKEAHKHFDKDVHTMEDALRAAFGQDPKDRPAMAPPEPDNSEGTDWLKRQSKKEAS